MSLYLKDPGATVDHAIDWSAYLAGQTILASSWAIAPDEAGGVSVANDAAEPTRTSVRLTGGRIGRLYRVSNRVTLSGGQVDERSFDMRVEER
jgi:hypothetical protein